MELCFEFTVIRPFKKTALGHRTDVSEVLKRGREGQKRGTKDKKAKLIYKK